MNKLHILVTFVVLAFIISIMSCTKDKKKQSGKVLVEILYMNHGPVQPVLREFKAQFKQFENRVEFKWYDFEIDLEFKKEKGIDFHTPIVVWVNNQKQIPVNGVEILFQGFPKNTGPTFARGVWEMKDLVAAIKNALGEE